MKKIVYIHGLASTRNSASVVNLRKYISKYKVDAFDVPFNPLEASEYIYEISQEYDLMIGSSLGGFYAQIGIPEVPRILINPALYAADNIYNISGYGTYDYLGPRTDGVQTFDTTAEYYQQLRECEERIATGMTEAKATNTYVVLGTEDEVLGETNHGLCIERYGESHITRIEMMHRVSEECVRDIIVPLADRILEGLY